MRRIALVLCTASCLVLGSCTHHVPAAGPGIHFLAANIDSTISPGVDFFRYANGAWLKANPIPASETNWGVGNLVQEETYSRLRTVCEDAAALRNPQQGSMEQKIGDYYRMALDSVRCDELGITPLKEDLNAIDAIHDLTGVCREIAVLQKYGAGPLFSMSIEQDEKNSAVYAVHLHQGGLGLPNRDYYTNTDTRTARIRESYVKHVAAMLTLLGTDTTAASKQSAAIMALETRLAKASRKLEDLRDPYKNYNKMAVQQLDRIAPSFAWNATLGAMSLAGVDSVIVGQPEFYREAEKVLRGESMETLKAYLRWNLISEFAPTLSKPFVDENFTFYHRILSGAKEQRPRWKRALDAEERSMGELLGQMFVKKFVPGSMKERYEKLVENMFAAYGERIQRLDWMSDGAKANALEKLHAVTKKVCYPDKWRDYSAMQIDRSSYCANQKQANIWRYMYQAGKLGKPVDRLEWDMTPQTYNAYYNPSNNEIVLPAAMFFIPGVPDSLLDDAVIYGYAGASTIGHEVTHGFDDEGRQFDERGNLRDWWTKEDALRFNERARVMVDQFSNYVVLDSLHVNGKASLGENIADLGGLVIGYDAFKRTHEGQADTLIDGLTPDQRYFLAYAYSWLGQMRDETLARQVLTDVHSPQFLRVNGPLSDIPEFYRAFGVKEGDPMYRADSVRVRIW